MRSLVIACGRDRRWHDKHGARERVWIWSILWAASTANRFVYSGSANVRHVLRIASAPYCTLGRSPFPPKRVPITSTPFDFANGPSTATAVSASAAPATASSQGRHRRLGYELPPAQAALRLRQKKEAWASFGIMADNGRPKGNLAAVARNSKTADSNALASRKAQPGPHNGVGADRLVR
ncbi:hypothetical protein GGI35DRAFT_99165 [Trichoderma velutinum]